jgi:hypothetical protein
MALTTAEKQQRYRQRHLGVKGRKQRIQFFVSVQAKAQLERLALHYGYTITRVIEKLTAEAERALLTLTGFRRKSTPSISTAAGGARQVTKRRPDTKPTPGFQKRRPGGAARLPCNQVAHADSNAALLDLSGQPRSN